MTEKLMVTGTNFNKTGKIMDISGMNMSINDLKVDYDRTYKGEHVTDAFEQTKFDILNKTEVINV